MIEQLLHIVTVLLSRKSASRHGGPVSMAKSRQNSRECKHGRDISPRFGSWNSKATHLVSDVAVLPATGPDLQGDFGHLFQNFFISG
jgi:hypothetical protein